MLEEHSLLHGEKILKSAGMELFKNTADLSSNMQIN